MNAREVFWKGLGTGGAGAMAIAGYPARLSILIFHSISITPEPLGHSDSTAASFERTVRLAKQAFNVMSLGEAVRHLAARTLPPRALCITFDDGYADNYTVALPILERHGACATFFVASGYLGGGRMFNDAVIESVRRCAHERLDLNELGLGVHELGNLSQRATAISKVLSQVKSMALVQREKAAAEIADAAGVTLQSDLMMSREQVVGLAEAGMEIGAHTHRHPILSSVSDQVAREELATCKQELEGLVNRPVSLFAYPNGRPEQDFKLRHAKMVQDAGFDAAVTTARGAATYGADVYQLPRFTPWDSTPEKFIARLMLNWRTEYALAR